MADPSQVQQLNPATLGLAQTNKAIGGGPGLLFLKDVQLPALLNIQANAPLGGSPPSLKAVFSSKKPPSPQRQVEEAAKAAIKSGGEAYFRDIASTVTSVDGSQIFGRDFAGSGLGNIGRAGFNGIDV